MTQQELELIEDNLIQTYTLKEWIALGKTMNQNEIESIRTWNQAKKQLYKGQMIHKATTHALNLTEEIRRLNGWPSAYRETEKAVPKEDEQK